MYYIYRALNLISGKSYIGLTTRTINKRWVEHLKYAKKDTSCDYNTVLSKAIRKYPENSWLVFQIDQTDNIEDLKELEIFYIAKYHTCISDPKCNGYNSTKGGDNGSETMAIPVTSVEILTGEIIKSFNNIAEANNYYHARCDVISKNNISFPNIDKNICILLTLVIKSMDRNTLIDYIASNLPNLVYQLDYKGNIINKFVDTNDAQLKTGISQTNICLCCNNKRRMAGGYQWCYKKNLNKHIHQKLRSLKLGKPVVQYGMDGKKIKTWMNIEEAAKKFGINGSHITSCCKKHRKSCQKFQWRFASDNLEFLPPVNQKRRVVCIETNEIFETRNHAAKHFHVDFSTIENSLNGHKIYIPYSFRYE